MASVEIDEELWFGSPGEDSELEERAAHSMAATAARVLGAKPFPAAAKKLEEVTRGAGMKIEQVVQVLESDPGLSMRLLRLVNSAGYALRVRCTSVRHAAALVGMRRLHQLATTAAVLDLFENERPLVKLLLNHAAAVGAVCRYLAVHVDLSPDELFTCGFLHDIGKLMLIDTEGQSYVDLLQEAGEQPDALHLLERQKYGFDHAVLGAHVLKNWQIPNPVPRVVAWHHSVGRAYQSDTHTAAMVQTLRLADLLSYLLRSNPDAEGVRKAAESDAARYLGISEAQLSAMWPDLTRLSQRIHAQPGANGSDLIPRQESLPPSLRSKLSLPAQSFGFAGNGMSVVPASVVPLKSLPAEVAHRTSEVPRAFACVVCKKASHGSRCPVCSGHVCVEHQVGPEQWCADCANVYKHDVKERGTPSWLRFSALGIVSGAAGLSLLAAALAGTSVIGALLGSTLLSSVAIVALFAGRSVWHKRHFMQRRGQVIDSDPESEQVLPFGLTVQPEPEIAVRAEPEAGPAAPSQAPPRWVRSELPSALSFPPAAEPLRPEPHAHPNVAPSVFPGVEHSAPESLAPAQREPVVRRQTRTDPVPAPRSAADIPPVLSVPAQARTPVAIAQSPGVLSVRAENPTTMSMPAPPIAPIAPVMAVAALEPELRVFRDEAPASSDGDVWRPVERTEPRLEVASLPPSSARPAPAAPLLAHTPTLRPFDAAPAEPRRMLRPLACWQPAAATLVGCRPNSLPPAIYACSAPSQG